jgi:sec-independent protein translocase protein TatB
MFDIGWSELLVIAVVALIAIGPKELPGVLRMVGQWMGKARRMAAEFQGQFQEAMREAEMADLKKSFDEVREAASGFTSGNLMTSLQRDVDKALDIEGVDKPTSVAPPTETTLTETPAAETAAAPSEPATAESIAADAAVAPTTPESPRAETFVEAEVHQAVQEPLAVVREAQPDVVQEAQPQHETAEPAESLKDAKAS